MASSVDLDWLQPAPADFCAGLKFDPADPQLGARLQQLALHRLDSTMAGAFGRAVSRLIRAGANVAPLSPFTLGILSNATMDILADELVAGAARQGIALKVIAAPYDTVDQEALDPASTINTAKCDAVLLAVDHRWLGLTAFTPQGSAAKIESARARLEQAVRAIAAASGAPCILQTVPVPPAEAFGSYERRVRGSVRAMVDEINAEIVKLADETGSYVFDAAALAERCGTELWFDPQRWNLYKLPFAVKCSGIYADWLGRLIGAIRGKSRKCLVLDLDNTLWGGVVGDDGVEGLKIGQGSAAGESFLAVQTYALELRERGIILAVCSKNNDETARQPFRTHPDMALREEHITVFQANWIDKASNLEAIARQLNIGLDALVFLDDNPAERAHVRAALPMVAVPELPADPSWYVRSLVQAGYFEAVAFSQEDIDRVASYTAEAKRAEVKLQARDLGDYLGSLGMQIAFAPFDAQGRSRIAQLINKSNQFNLTTRRYTEAEVAAAETDRQVFTLQVRLKDRYGDFGMIGVIVGRPVAETARRVLELDTWLMSCRVLGRKVEEAMLRETVHHARLAGFEALAGAYQPTAKNNMVAEHYDKLGFTLTGTDADGVKRYHYELAAASTAELPFAVERRKTMALSKAS